MPPPPKHPSVDGDLGLDARVVGRQRGIPHHALCVQRPVPAEGLLHMKVLGGAGRCLSLYVRAEC